jgi:hypothetical protein
VLDAEELDGDNPADDWEAQPSIIEDDEGHQLNGTVETSEAVEADDDDPPAPKVRTTPAPGTAAERAAARRARLREKKDV